MDCYSQHGAGVLASKIEGYWLARGHAVRVERFEIVPGMWGVRSNLVNGLPSRGLPALDGVQGTTRSMRDNLDETLDLLLTEAADDRID